MTAGAARGPRPERLTRAAREVDLRRATIADLDGIEAIERRAFEHDRLSRHSLRRFLSSDRSEVIAAAAPGAVCGYAVVLFRRDSDAARLYSLAVDPQAAGLGVGRRLLSACEASAAAHGCAKLRLEVRADNARALGLYRRNGYRELGLRANYYADGGAALRLEKIL